MKIKFEDFKKYNVGIDWNILKLGFYGFAYMKPQFDKNDIERYACNILSKSSNDNYNVALLASAKSLDDFEVSESLNKLVDNKSMEKDKRKWIAIYLLKTLDALDDKDYINGLVTVGDVWAMFDFPDFSPHIIQGKNNNITPTEYYTEDNYITIKNVNREWAYKQIE